VTVVKRALSSFITLQEARATFLLDGVVMTNNNNTNKSPLNLTNLINPAIRAINPQTTKAMAIIIIQMPDLIFTANLLLLLLMITLPRPLLKFITLLVVKVTSVWEMNLLIMAEEVETKEKKLKRPLLRSTILPVARATSLWAKNLKIDVSQIGSEGCGCV